MSVVGLRSHVVAAACLILATLIMASSASQAEDPFPRIRKAFVDSKNHKTWPKGQWRPITTKQYQLLLRQAQPKKAGPSPAQIDHVDYSATFSAKRLLLIDGTLDAVVRRSQPGPVLLSLEPVNLAMKNLMWPNGDAAIWGTSSSGLTLLYVDKQRGHLKGKWSCRGRPLLDFVEFDIKLLPSTASRLLLRLPEDHKLESSIGIVRSLKQPEEAGWRVWKVDLGSETNCQIRISPIPKSTNKTPMVLYDQITSYVTQLAELEVQTSLTVDVHREQVSQLNFAISRNLEILSVTYGGEAAVDWSLSDSRGQRGITRKRLTLRFPDTISGRSRPIQIFGRTALRLGREQTMPRIQLLRGHLLSGRFSLTIPPPLELRTLASPGLRQTAVDSGSTEGHKLTFQQHQARASMRVDVGYPTSALSAHVVSHVDTSKTTWILTSNIDWTDQSRVTFNTRCEFPNNWEIIDVKSASPSVTNDLANWVVTRESDRQILTIEFREPLGKESVRIIAARIRDRDSTSTPGLNITLPKPLDCIDVETPTLAITTPLGYRIEPVVEADVESVDLNSFAEDSNSDIIPMPQPDQQLWLFRPTNTAESATLRIEMSQNQNDKNKKSAVTESPSAPDAKDVDLQTLTKELVAGNSIATLRLQSLIFPSQNGVNLHSATFSILGATDGAGLQFELAPIAELIKVEVNGHSATPTQLGSVFEIPPLETGTIKQIVVQYQTRSTPCVLQGRMAIPIPQISIPVLDVEWQAALPPGMRLLGEPIGTRLQSGLWNATWSQRLFGPLGRSQESPRFRPHELESWTSLLSEDKLTSSIESSSFAPAHWSVFTARSLQLPDEFSVTLCNEFQLHFISWIALLGSLVTICLVRIRQVSARRGIGVLWLSFCLVAASCVPAAYAQIVGGCLIGTCIGALLPRHLLIKPKSTNETATPNKPMESTVSFRIASASHVMLFVVTILGTTAAQEIVQDRSTEKVDAAADDFAAGTFDVLIPKDPSQRPEDATPQIVHISEDLYQRLLEIKRQRKRAPEYLIISASYTGSVDRQNRAIFLRSRFRVAVLSPAPKTRVHFELTNPNLGGADACKVNGQSHAVLLPKNGQKGLVVELVRSENTDAVGPAIHEVEFVLHPSRKLEGVIKMGIPTIVQSHLNLEFSKTFSTLNLPSAGEIDQRKRVVDAQLGKTAELLVQWSDQPAESQLALKGTTASNMVIEVLPTHSRFHIQARYQFESKSVDSVHWRIPNSWISKLIVQRVADSAGNPLPYRILTADDSAPAELWIALPSTQEKEIVVNATFLLPREDDKQSSEQLKVPVWIPCAQQSQDVGLKAESIKVGIVTAADLNIQAKTTENQQAQRLEPDLFPKNWSEMQNVRRPEIAYEITAPTELSFSVIPYAPLRKVRIQHAGHVSLDRLEWSIVIHVETTNAPAFAHRLMIGPQSLSGAQLRIDSVSVRNENNTDQLLHKSLIGNRLTLFLRDKIINLPDGTNKGLQVIVIKGHLPIRRGVTLPLIRFEDAETTESTLRIASDLQMQVKIVVEQGDVTPLEAPTPLPDEQREILHGRFRLLDDASRIRIQVSQKRRPVEVQMATVLEPTILQPTAIQPAAQTLLKQTTLIRFPNRKPRSQVTVLLPPGLKLIKSSPNVSDTELMENGSTRLLLQPTKTQSRNSITIETSMPLAGSGPWPIVPLQTPNATVTDRFLLISSPKYLMTDQSDIEQTETREWLKLLVPNSSNSSYDRVYRATGSNCQLTRSETIPAADNVMIPLIETEIWVSENGSINGRSLLYLFKSGQDKLQVRCHSTCRIRAIIVDGNPVHIDDKQQSEFDLPLQTARNNQTVIVYWRMESDPDEWVSSPVNASLPSFTNALVERTIVTLIPAKDHRLIRPRGFDEQKSVALGLVRVQGLLDVCRRTTNDFGQPDSNAWHRLLAHLKSVNSQLEHSPADARTREQKKRTAEVSSQVEEIRALTLDNENSLSDAPESRIVSLFGAFDTVGAPSELITTRVDNEWAQRLENQPIKLSMWRVPKMMLVIPIAIGVFVIFCIILRRVVKWQTAEFLHQYYPVSWLVIGLIWWAYLVPSVVGVGFVVIASFLAIRQKTRKQKEVVSPLEH